MKISKEFIKDMGVCDEAYAWYSETFGDDIRGYFEVYDRVVEATTVEGVEEYHQGELKPGGWVFWSFEIRNRADAIKWWGNHSYKDEWKIEGPYHEPLIDKEGYEPSEFLATSLEECIIELEAGLQEICSEEELRKVLRPQRIVTAFDDDGNEVSRYKPYIDNEPLGPGERITITYTDATREFFDSHEDFTEAYEVQKDIIIADRKKATFVSQKVTEPVDNFEAWEVKPQVWN